MRLGRYTFRSTVASFTFLPTSSIVTPTCSKVIPTDHEIAVTRNTFTPLNSKVTPTSSKVTYRSSNKIIAVFIVIPPSSKNRETSFTFYPCFSGIVQLTV